MNRFDSTTSNAEILSQQNKDKLGKHAACKQCFFL